jgi:hypothetical protein
MIDAHVGLWDPGPLRYLWLDSAEALSNSTSKASDHNGSHSQGSRPTRAMGSRFVPYHAAPERAEITRFEQTVTDWEQREYFDL